MDDSDLKKTHPQKHYLKILCKLMFYLGMGNYWYEDAELTGFRMRLYKVWSFISNMYAIINVCNEVLGNLRTDLTEQERANCQQLSSAHPCLALKIVFVQINREGVKVLLKRLLEGTRSNFKCMDLERESVKQFKIHTFLLASSCYFTLISAAIEAIRIHFKEGVPIRTEIVYYPTLSGSGVFVNILRVLVEIHWYWIVSMLVVTDTLTVCSLVIVRHKFKVIQKYYQQLSHGESLPVSKKELQKEFEKQFIVGIQMHEDALWCSHNLQRHLGSVISMQMMESFVLLVMCLMKLVVGERTLTYMLASFVFLACIVVITGVYMTVAGDITYEASIVPTSMFHCGWEKHAGRRTRVLTVVALQRGQDPVVLTAFGIITLSYSTYISVLRSSYSFFAVMY